MELPQLASGRITVLSNIRRRRGYRRFVVSTAHGWLCRDSSVLVVSPNVLDSCCDFLAALALQPPHAANRNDGGCRGGGDDCLGGGMSLGAAAAVYVQVCF